MISWPSKGSQASAVGISGAAGQRPHTDRNEAVRAIKGHGEQAVDRFEQPLDGHRRASWERWPVRSDQPDRDPSGRVLDERGSYRRRSGSLE